jgi:ubiquitin thioesterase OTU1
MRIKAIFDGSLETKILTLGSSANVYDLLQEIENRENILHNGIVLHLSDYDPNTPLEALGLLNYDSIRVLKGTKPQKPERNFCIKEMPNDNSCLFRAVAFVTKTFAEPKPLRDLIAEYIWTNQHEYNSSILGENPLEYCGWIRGEDHWGGGIELAIFSRIYQVELTCFDVKTCSMIRFGTDYPQRCFVVYSGIHYNAVYEEKASSREWITKFDVDDLEAIEKVKELVNILKSSHEYTDVSDFFVKCDECGLTFKGEQEAQAHAFATKHNSFSEVD